MVNYPHKVAKKTLVSTQRKHPVDFANRGMTFEKMINESNQYYLSRGLAVIHKKPTPIQIVKVDYPRRSRAKIVEAYFRQASTTDYSGVGNTAKAIHADEKFSSTSNRSYGGSCSARRYLFRSLAFCKVE